MAGDIASDQQLTLYLQGGTIDRLTSLGQQDGLSPVEFAEVLLEEGLRMAAHPGIVFRSGPVGRRPALATGPDIWEIARILREYPDSPDEAVRITAKLMSLPANKVRVALDYYLDYRAEIDDWLRRLDEEANAAEDLWRQQQGLPAL